MKTLILICGVLAASCAFAGEIDLAAGASATVNANDPTVVKCAASSKDVCSVKMYSASVYELFEGANTVGVWQTLDEAVAMAKKMQDAGLCQ